MKAFAAFRRLRAARAAVGRFPTIGTKRPHGLPNELIVTLTSYPARYPTLAMTLKSLLDQTVAANRTVLWIAYDDLDALPANVRALTAFGLEIRGCENLRSYKKLIPALVEWPGAALVTADDDIYYPPYWLDGLVTAHVTYPARVVAWRAHRAVANPNGTLASYADWEFAVNAVHIDGPGEALFPTGVGGILYPPASLPPEVIDKEAFLRLCPTGDDIWLYWMAKRAGTLHARVGGWIDFVEWPGSQSIGLRFKNITGEGNDRQIRAMERNIGRL